ncbi:MAG: 5'/3'-nucleotidase SurE [Acidobacteria bacterium]|nr:5'/3'-nucleotidase SurE [Acidobacteriota bacterium]
MPSILLTNDDGVDAPGIVALHRALGEIGDVLRVAPDRDQSGAGHALTLNSPLRIRQVGEDAHAVDGTPTDCVNLGIFQLLDRRPDLVVSGINPTPNLGDDITYSGTVSAALEGTLLGVPSFAISCDGGPGRVCFQQAAGVACEVARRILRDGLPGDMLLNVNVPREASRGFRVARQGRRIYTEGVVERIDPMGRLYYWIGGVAPEWRDDPSSDYAALKAGHVSLTPLRIDLTQESVLAELASRWEP